MIQTGKRLDGLTVADLDEFATACRARQQRTGKGWHHYKSALANTHLVLFHLNILPEPPRTGGPVDFAVRLAGITEPIAAAMIAYLNAKKATCGLRVAYRGSARPLTGLRARNPWTRNLVGGTAGQTRHRTDDPAR